MVQNSLIIIPTYNEVANIGPMVLKLFSLYPEISILIVDDNSPDNTAYIVKKMKLVHPNLHLLERARKMGLGTAYKDGFIWALSQNYEFIFQMDCDFSHTPEDIKLLYQNLIEQNADLAIGSRYSEGTIRTQDWPWYRLALSLGSSFLLRLFTGLTIKDLTGGFKGFRRSALIKINLKKLVSKGYVFQFEMNYKAFDLNFKIIEVPIVFHQRVTGKSKMSFMIMLEAFYVFFYLRFKKFFGSING